jgi:hypothetical protein
MRKQEHAMKVSPQLILLVLFLFTIPATAAPEAATGGESAICYRGGSGFLISPPPGWVNLRDAATEFGLCLLFAPEGSSFDNAPAII